jgi:hypothetical protein
VLILELLNKWSAFPVKKNFRKFDHFSGGVSASEKHFSACLSHPMRFSPSNRGNSNLTPLLKDWANTWSFEWLLLVGWLGWV